MQASSITPPLRGSRRSPSSSRRGANAASKRDAHPGTRASRPHMAWRSLGRLRRRDGTVAGPCPSFGLANAVYAGRVAACRQRCADAPPPPARNKDAGGTPAFPGGASPAAGPPSPGREGSFERETEDLDGLSGARKSSGSPRRLASCVLVVLRVPSWITLFFVVSGKDAGGTPAFPGGASPAAGPPSPGREGSFERETGDLDGLSGARKGSGSPRRLASCVLVVLRVPSWITLFFVVSGKVAGGTPAFPGGAPPAVEPEGGQRGVA